MNANAHRIPPSPETRNAAARGAWWVLGAPALALAATLMLFAADASGDWIGALWLAAVLWTIAASLVQAVWAGLRHDDWSAFVCQSLPHREALASRDDDHDYFFRSGSYAYRRTRDEHEILLREGDRHLEDHDRTGTLG